MEPLDAIKSRRSVRIYKTDDVAEETIAKLMEAVRWAPSWANSQCWEIILVRNAETKARLVNLFSPRNPARQACVQAPLLVVGCARLGKAGCKQGNYVTDKGDWFMFDMGIALQNLCLAAHSLGLGTVHVGYFDARKAGELLGLPEGVVAVEVIPVGWPAEDPPPPKRRELADFVHRERFGGK